MKKGEKKIVYLSTFSSQGLLESKKKMMITMHLSEIIMQHKVLKMKNAWLPLLFFSHAIILTKT